MREEREWLFETDSLDGFEFHSVEVDIVAVQNSVAEFHEPEYTASFLDDSDQFYANISCLWIEYCLHHSLRFARFALYYQTNRFCISYIELLISSIFLRIGCFHVFYFNLDNPENITNTSSTLLDWSLSLSYSTILIVLLHRSVTLDKSSHYSTISN